MSVFENAAAARKARNYVAKMTRLGLMIEHDVSLTFDHLETPFGVVHKLEAYRTELRWAAKLPVDAFMAEYKFASVLLANERLRAIKSDIRFIGSMLANVAMIFDCAALTMKLVAAGSDWNKVALGEDRLDFVVGSLRPDSIVVA